MKAIDRMIRDALSEEDAELHERFGGQQPIHETVKDFLSFKPRLLLIGAIAVTFVAMAIAVFSVMRFLNAPEIRDMLLWGGVGLFSLLVVSTIKIWAWMEMSKNAVTRDIKRLELKIVNLSGRINKLPIAADDNQ